MASQPPLLMSPSQHEMSATKRQDSVRKLEHQGSSQKNLLGSGLNVSNSFIIEPILENKTAGAVHLRPRSQYQSRVPSS